MNIQRTERPSEPEGSYLRTNPIQAFFSQRPVQIALLMIFGAATLAIALFDQYIEPFSLSGDATLSLDTDDAEQTTSSEAPEDARSVDVVGGVASRDVIVTHDFEYILPLDDDIGEQRQHAWKATLPIWTYNEGVLYDQYRLVRQALERPRNRLCYETIGHSTPGYTGTRDDPPDDAQSEEAQLEAAEAQQRVNEADRTALQECLRHGLKPGQLSDKERVSLACDDRMRETIRDILEITEFTKEQCAAFATAGFNSNLRRSIEHQLDERLFNHIVEDQDALTALREAVDPNQSSNARGFQLRQENEFGRAAGARTAVAPQRDNPGADSAQRTTKQRNTNGAQQAPDNADVTEISTQDTEIVDNIDGYVTLDEARQTTRENTDDGLSDTWSDAEATAIRAVAAQLLRANTTYDEKRTLEARQAAAQREFNRYQATPYRRGQTLLSKGQSIEQKDAEIINQMNLTAPRIARPFWHVFALALLLLVLTFSIGAATSEDEEGWATRDIAMMGLVLLLQIALIRIGFELSDRMLISDKPIVAAALLAALPYGAGAMVVKTLTSSRNAFAFTAISSVLVAAISGYDITWFAVSLVSGIVGAASLQALEKRSSILRAAVFASVATAGIIAAFGAIGLIDRGGPKTLIVMAAAMGAFFLTAIFALGLPVIIEETFKYTTRSTLLELTDDGHKLRTKLQRAPGTLVHSLAVADLTAAACKEIGANVLLARVGCTFHDIGKLRAPGYFGENQFDPNPHSELTARESAERIIAHVKDGVEEAKKEGLPNEVIDFIRTHHGTMLVRHFYNVTCNEEGTENVDPRDFQYPGPLPQTKETGICLIADGVEAMTRSLPDRSPDNIAKAVRDKINLINQENQLIDSGLTLREVQIVEKSLIENLCTMHHGRPTYAKAPQEDTPTPDAAERTTPELALPPRSQPTE